FLFFSDVFASFRTASQRLRYINRYYRNIVRYPCMNCTSVYNKKGSLNTHLRYECGQPPRFKCPYCDMISKKTSNVQQHIRRKHKGSTVYVLDTHIIQLGVFDMVTQKLEDDTSPRKLNQQPNKSTKKRFSCPRCGSTFNRKNNLGTHMKYECGQLPRFGCPYCQYCSKKSSNIRAHVPRKHFGLTYQVNSSILPSSTRNQLENESSSIFPNLNMIDGNLVNKSNFMWEKVLNRKYPCPNCKSVFSRKGGLTYHQKYECGQMPRFICPYCNYRAKHISNSRRHIRNCHPGRDVYTIDICQLE
ncbi:hypothetical protein M0802_014882, partial [Mischocyttarus mexicanus]